MPVKTTDKVQFEMLRTRTVFLLWVTLCVISPKTFCADPKKLFEADIVRLRNAIVEANTAIRKAYGDSYSNCPSLNVPKYQPSKAEIDFDEYLNSSTSPYLFK